MKKSLTLLPLFASFYLHSICQEITNSNAAPFSNSRIAKILNGDWSGSIYQKSVKKPYIIQLSCNVQKNEFKISYPSLGCSGVWNIEKTSDTSIDFREHIVTGKSACADGGLVTLELINSKQLSCNFHLPNSKVTIAKGELVSNNSNIIVSKAPVPDTIKKSIVQEIKTSSSANKNMALNDGRLPGMKSQSDSNISSVEGYKAILKNVVTDNNGSKHGDIYFIIDGIEYLAVHGEWIRNWIEFQNKGTKIIGCSVGQKKTMEGYSEYWVEKSGNYLLIKNYYVGGNAQIANEELIKKIAFKSPQNEDIYDPNNINYAGDAEGTTPFVPIGANKKTTKSSNTNVNQAKATANTKILKLISPTYTLGDLPHLVFKDFTTHKEQEYECDWTLPAIKEIEKKCEDHDGCPALKGQAYNVMLELKLMDIELYDTASGEMKPTGKKEKRWVIIAATKISTPK